jgi:hypothetical protein
VSAASAAQLRVTVTDVWDTVAVEASPEMTIREVKARALLEATGRTLAPAGYEVKHRGALVDESRTVASLGLSNGAPLIVLPARRLPVR